jgi:hypothetical protein
MHTRHEQQGTLMKMDTMTHEAVKIEKNIKNTKNQNDDHRVIRKTININFEMQIKSHRGNRKLIHNQLNERYYKTAHLCNPLLLQFFSKQLNFCRYYFKFIYPKGSEMTIITFCHKHTVCVFFTCVMKIVI